MADEKKKTVYFTTGNGYIEYAKNFKPVKYDPNKGERGGPVQVEPGDRESSYQVNLVMTGEERDEMKKLVDDIVEARQNELGSKFKLRRTPYAKWEPSKGSDDSMLSLEDALVFKFEQRGDWVAPIVSDTFGDDQTEYLKAKKILIGNGSQGRINGSFYLPNPKENLFSVRLQFSGIQIKELIKYKRKAFSEMEGGTPFAEPEEESVPF